MFVFAFGIEKYLGTRRNVHEKAMNRLWCVRVCSGSQTRALQLSRNTKTIFISPGLCICGFSSHYGMAAAHPGEATSSCHISNRLLQAPCSSHQDQPFTLNSQPRARPCMHAKSKIDTPRVGVPVRTFPETTANME